MVFDLETVRRLDLPDLLYPSAETIKAPSNYKDEAKIKEYVQKKETEMISKMGLDPLRSQICSYAILAINDPLTLEGPTVLFKAGTDEKALLESFESNLNDLEDAGISLFPVVTYNGMRFDLGALITAYMRRKMPIPAVLKTVWQQRYDQNMHVDMFRILGEEGSLHDWAHALDIAPPVGKGDMVQGWFDGNDFESIKNHNVSDVWTTYDIYKRWIP